MNMYWKIAVRLLRKRISKSVTVALGIFLASIMVTALGTTVTSFLSYATENHIKAVDFLLTAEDGSGGILRSGNVRYVGIGLCAVTAVLIIWGACALVYNAFAISVRSRRWGFRILSSAGATTWQLRIVTLIEILLLCIPGILAGLPAGMFFGKLATVRTAAHIVAAPGFSAYSSIRVHMEPVVAVCGVLILFLAVISAALMPTVPIEKVLVGKNQETGGRKRGKFSLLTSSRPGFQWTMAKKYYRDDSMTYLNSTVSLVVSMMITVTLSSFASHMESMIRLDGDTPVRGSSFAPVFSSVHLVLAAFMIVMFMISAVNAFNAISANVLERKREYVMLAALGMTMKEIRRMLNMECMIYGIVSLVISVPASLVLAAVISGIFLGSGGYIFPWRGLLPSCLCICFVILGSMAYAGKKLSDSNLSDALRSS